MSQIDYEQREDVYNRAIAKFGTLVQKIVAIEEMAELVKEICKDLRRTIGIERPFYGAPNIKNIIEECADVRIMLEQLNLMYDISDDVASEVDSKVARLESRVDGGCRNPDCLLTKLCSRTEAECGKYEHS